LIDFQITFSGTLHGQFVTKLSLNIPPHHKRVATLPCTIFWPLAILAFHMRPSYRPYYSSCL